MQQFDQPCVVPYRGSSGHSCCVCNVFDVPAAQIDLGCFQYRYYCEQHVPKPRAVTTSRSASKPKPLKIKESKPPRATRQPKVRIIQPKPPKPKRHTHEDTIVGLLAERPFGRESLFEVSGVPPGSLKNMMPRLVEKGSIIQREHFSFRDRFVWYALPGQEEALEAFALQEIERRSQPTQAQRILELVAGNPLSIHLLADRLNCSAAAAQEAVRRLRQKGLIVSTIAMARDNPESWIALVEEQHLLERLRHNYNPKKRNAILSYLAQYPDSSVNAIKMALKCHYKSVIKVLRVLIDQELVEAVQQGNYIVYRLKENHAASD